MYVCMCLSFQSKKKRKVVVLKLLIKGETTLNCLKTIGTTKKKIINTFQILLLFHSR